MAQAFGQLTAETGARADTDINHLSLDGKTPRGGKDADGKAESRRPSQSRFFPSPNGMSRRNPATGGLTSATFVEALGEKMDARVMADNPLHRSPGAQARPCPRGTRHTNRKGDDLSDHVI